MSDSPVDKTGNISETLARGTEQANPTHDAKCQPPDLETLRKDVEGFFDSFHEPPEQLRSQVLALISRVEAQALDAKRASNRYGRLTLHFCDDHLQIALDESSGCLRCKVEALEQERSDNADKYIELSLRWDAAETRLRHETAANAARDAEIHRSLDALDALLRQAYRERDARLSTDHLRLAMESTWRAAQEAQAHEIALLRERAERAEAALGDAVARPQPPTCATCRWWMKDSQGDTGECFQADTVAWNGDGSYNITKEWFGCTLWSARPAQEGDAP
jgi:hypothetical protein